MVSKKNIKKHSCLMIWWFWPTLMIKNQHIRNTSEESCDIADWNIGFEITEINYILNRKPRRVYIFL